MAPEKIDTFLLEKLRRSFHKQIVQRNQDLLSKYDELTKAAYLFLYVSDESVNNSNFVPNLFHIERVVDVRDEVLRAWNLLIGIYREVEANIEHKSCKKILTDVSSRIEQIISNTKKAVKLENQLHNEHMVTPNTPEFAVVTIAQTIMRFGRDSEIADVLNNATKKEYGILSTEAHYVNFMQSLVNALGNENPEDVNKWKAIGRHCRKPIITVLLRHSRNRKAALNHILQECNWLTQQLIRISSKEGDYKPF